VLLFQTKADDFFIFMKRNSKLPLFLGLAALSTLLWFTVLTKECYGSNCFKKQEPLEQSEVYKSCYEMGKTQDFGKYFEFGDKARYAHHSYLNKQQDPLVIEIGGFTGEDSQALLDNYPGISLHVYEPHPRYVAKLVTRFKDDKRVTIYPYGLDSVARVAELTDSTDASSVYMKKQEAANANRVQIFLREAVPEFRTQVNLFGKTVSLLNVNCEGCEYGLLETITSLDAANLFDNIQVQFHIIPGDDTLERYCSIEALLSRTHERTFGFHFIWENWRRKEFVK
jgi:FkbM family methyltransferase